MSRDVRDYPALFSPNRTACNHSDGTRFSKFHCKRLQQNGEAAGHAWLSFLAWKNIIFCHHCKLFSSGYPLAQHSMPLLSVGTALVPPFWSGRYLAREEVLARVKIIWFIGFNGAIHWSFSWRGLGVALSGLAFVTSQISIITPRCNPSKFLHTTEWGPAKVFQIGPRAC